MKKAKIKMTSMKTTMSKKTDPLVLLLVQQGPDPGPARAGPLQGAAVLLLLRHHPPGAEVGGQPDGLDLVGKVVVDGAGARDDDPPDVLAAPSGRAVDAVVAGTVLVALPADAPAALLHVGLDPGLDVLDLREEGEGEAKWQKLNVQS